MADIDLVKRNLGKMIDQGAPESDINAYLSTEGYSSPEAWRSALASPAARPKTVGAAMVAPSPRIEDAPSIGPGPRTSTMPDEGRPWGEVASSFARNILPTTGKAVLGSVNALTVGLPQTAAGLYDLGKGVVTKVNRYQPGPGQTTMGPRPAAGGEETADAVGAHYGNLLTAEGFKNTLADDPGSLLMDAATLGTLGSGLPGKAGQVAGIISKADPLTATGNVLSGGTKVADVVGANALGRTTGAGARSVRDAGSAGRELGAGIGRDAETIANADALVTNMNKGAEVDNVVGRAKSALGQAIKERGKDYRSGMLDISKDATVLDFAPIDAAVTKADQIANYKGVRLNRSAGETNQEISTIVNDWKTLNPQSPLFKGVDPAELTAANFHTPEGLDALKRVVGDIRDTLDQGSPARTAADNAYNAIKGQIVEQAPAYAKVMADYERASDKIREASKTFSLTERATNDTAARKLLSATRDNVQTNNKGRANVLDMLAEHDSTLPYAIAGQAFQSPLPRGLVANGTAAYGASHVLPGILADPVTAIGTMAAFSPRVVGNVVYYGGRAIGAVEDVANALHITPQNLRMLEQGGYQAGRPEDIRQRATTLRNRNALAAP